MNLFSKRFGYQLAGGGGTILLGVLAAAGAQRQGLQVDETLPRLDQPAWAASMPQPIAAGPMDYDAGPAMPSFGFPSAAFSAPAHDEPAHNQPAPSQPARETTSQAAPSQAAELPPMMEIQPVAYEQPVTEEPPPESTYHASHGQAGPAAEPVNALRSDASPSMTDAPPAFGMPDFQPMASHETAPPTASLAMPTSARAAHESDRHEVHVADEHAPAAAMPELDLSFDAMGPMPSGYAPVQPSAAPESFPLLPPPAGREIEPSYGDAEPAPANPARGAMPMGAAELPQPPTAQPNTNQYPATQYAANPYTDNPHPPARLASVDSRAMSAASTLIGSAEPGDRRLEGMQSPSVVIHKRAPAEIKVGQPASFVVYVQNVGNVEAIDVQVHDRIPAGMELIDAAPQPEIRGDELLWNLGALPAGDQRSITLQLVAREEGELGSVARVTFEAAASVRTRSTRPELKIVQQLRPDVLIGQQLEIDLEVSNVGTGEATGVILQVDVPDGFDHPRGKQLDNALGSLRPGEVRHEILRLRAVAPGRIENTVRLIASDAPPATHTAMVEVTAPELNVQLTGPSRRYLERQATYSVNLENRGTAAASNVELVAYLDRGFTFVSTENEGTYDPNRHAVLWSLPNLPAGAAGSVPLTLLPVQQGDHAIRLEAVADLNQTAKSESSVMVEAQSELTFSIADTADPIELGAETSYEIRVQNIGSRDDTNVQVRLQLPAGLDLLRSDADAQTDGRGGVVFAPHPQLPAGGELIYRVAVRGTQADTHVIGAIVTSDQSRVPVTKQESTLVYADQ